MERNTRVPRNDANPTIPRLRWLRRALVPAAAAILGMTLVSPPSAAAEEAEAVEAAAFQHYVALGDSFVAGPLVREQQAGVRVPLLGCMQSANNYPKMLAERIGVAELTDASCSGARMEHFYEQQFNDTLPQFDALRPETDLVTVGIAGNDFGFSEVFIECAKQSLGNPLGNPCSNHYGDELDVRIDGLRGEISQVYADIADRSPNATVLSVGYLQILPESGGCWPSTPIARGDVAFLDAAQTRLNTVIKEEAEAHGAVFVDVLERGRDVCKASGTRWVEGLIPENGAPVHPNRVGMEATADFVQAAVGVPSPAL